MAHFLPKNRIEPAKRKYDAQCKKVLADKYILEYILKNVVSEVEGYTIPEIIHCIEGEPEVGEVSVLEGGPGNIKGENTEDSSIVEGTIRYDVRFSIITKNKEPIKLIIDLEAQKDTNPGYQLVTRGIVYCARMISSQIKQEFTLDKYDDCKKVYSIWICFQSPGNIGNAISKYSIQKKDMLGCIPVKKAAYDKLCVVQIYLKEHADDGGNEVIRLLNTIFSDDMSKDKILEELETEYQIPTETGLKKEVDLMCNLSERVWERGLMEGRSEG